MTRELSSIDIEELQAKAKERTVKTQSIEYDLETLLRRIKNGTIKIDPSYQRRHRWKDETSSRLIESLLLNIPIPTIYLSQDVDLDTDMDDSIPIFTVIDGQQRLSAIRDFMSGDLVLTGLEVLDTLNGFAYEDLPKFLKRRLDDRTIGCLRIDSTVDELVKYDIFERLNSGSVELTPQELRNAAYRGSFNEMIKRLSANEMFQEMTCMSEARRDKMEDVELVLRFFALTDGRYLNYKPNMKDFLNSSMGGFSDLSDEELCQYENRFIEQFGGIRSIFGNQPFAKRKKNQRSLASRFNAAVFDAVVVAYDNVKDCKPNASKALNALFDSETFQEDISGSINDSKKLFGRISAVEAAIGNGN